MECAVRKDDFFPVIADAVSWKKICGFGQGQQIRQGYGVIFRL